MKRVCIWTVCLLLAVLAGCKEKKSRMLRFSHHLHVVENEMDCETCGLLDLSFHEIVHECGYESAFGRSVCGAYCLTKELDGTA